MTVADREAVAGAIWRALGAFDLHEYTDGVMDSLDTVIEWDDEEGDDGDW